ncbi:MAG: right-handed parallel beta-helix repeat-containing protein [Halodesulfurarchaeum sp.]
MSVSAARALVIFALLGAIGFGAAVSPAGAQSAVTFVDSDVTADTTWTAEEGPYRLVGNVTVASNATLTVGPGTTVEFAEGVTLSVAGEFVTSGTESSPVRLIASRPISTPGSWGSIRTVGSESPIVSLTHTEVAHATNGISIQTADSTLRISETVFTSISGSGIRVKRADARTELAVRESRFQHVGNGIVAGRTDLIPVETASNWSITHSTFSSVDGTGVRIEADRITRFTLRANVFDGMAVNAVRLESERIRAAEIRSNRVTDSTRAVSVETADVSVFAIAGNEFSVSGTAVDLRLERNVFGLRIADNRIVGGGTGVAIVHDPRRDGFYSFDLSVTENEIRGQEKSGIRLATSAFSDSSMSIRNNTVAENGRYGIRLTVDAFQDAVVADNRIRKNGYSGLSMTAWEVRNTIVRGNLVQSNGASGIEIVARSTMEGVTVTGNELLDNAREGLLIRSGHQTDGRYTVRENVVAANAYGIVLTGPQTGVLSKNSIVFNTVGYWEREPRPDADPGIGVLVTDNATHIELVRNDIYGNRVGLQTSIEGTVSAAGNYWGAESGPYHRSINPEGEGNAVVTHTGWVDLVEVRTEPVSERYWRPNVTLSIDPNPAWPGQRVRISAAGSSDRDGAISTYRFTIGGHTTGTNRPLRTVTYTALGSYPVSLWVEDGMGIESAKPATALLRIEPQPTTTEPTTAVTTTQPPTVVTTARTTVPPQPPEGGGPGLLGWTGAGLGAILYGIAVVFGARGMYETLTEKPLSVRGRRIQVLAFAGVTVWAVASVMGPSVLRMVAAIGLLSWGVLTGFAFALVKFRR